jgi:hypothetical protein
MQALFLALQSHINQNVPQLKTIELDLNQLEQETPPVHFPCCLIRFEDGSEFIQRKKGLEIPFIIALKLGFRVLGSTDQNAPTPMRTTALAHLNTIEQVIANLHQHTFANCTPTAASGFSTDPPNRPDIVVYNILLSLQYCLTTPISAQPQYTPWNTLQQNDPQLPEPTLTINHDIITQIP